jgi:hypothetical protein
MKEENERKSKWRRKKINENVKAKMKAIIGEIMA